jgi:hypothetical protein
MVRQQRLLYNHPDIKSRADALANRPTFGAVVSRKGMLPQMANIERLCGDNQGENSASI